MGRLVRVVLVSQRLLSLSLVRVLVLVLRRLLVKVRLLLLMRSWLEKGGHLLKIESGRSPFFFVFRFPLTCYDYDETSTRPARRDLG